MQKALTDRLIAETGESDPFFAQLKIQREQEKHLKAIEEWQRTRQEEIAKDEKIQRDEIARIGQVNRQAIADYEKFRREQIFLLEQQKQQELADYEQRQLDAIAAWEQEQVRVIQQELIANLEAINKTLRDIFHKLPGADDLLGTNTTGIRWGGIRWGGTAWRADRAGDGWYGFSGVDQPASARAP